MYPTKLFPIKTDNVYEVFASTEMPVKVCEIVPPLLKATMFPSGNGKLKYDELGCQEPATPTVVHPGIGPKLYAQVPVQGLVMGLKVSKEAFWMGIVESAYSGKLLNPAIESARQTKSNLNFMIQPLDSLRDVSSRRMKLARHSAESQLS